jgi:DNA-binding SARP family transcriptional activator/predicted ATPase
VTLGFIGRIVKGWCSQNVPKNTPLAVIIAFMHLALSLLGNFHIILDGTAVSQFRSDKERALLALLVLDRERPYRRETLAGLFWGDQPQKLAFNNLRKTIHRLRQTLQDDVAAEPCLLVTAKEVQWNPAADVWVDVWVFATLVEQSRQHQHRRVESCVVCQEWLETAVALYHHNLLEGFALGDSPAFDEWVATRREPLRVQALSALNHLIAHHELSGETERAITQARRLLTLEPWQESAHRSLMRLLAASGERGTALAQYDLCRRLLANELAIEPEQETTSLYEAIKAGEVAQPPLPRVQTLPTAVTPFIGREAECNHLRQKLLHPATRLLTLVGEGGIGKTRLALTAVTQVQHDFPDGIWFVVLAALDKETNSESRLVMVIAAALGLRLTGSQTPKAQLLAALKSWHCLLLLDNFESVLEEAALVAEILQVAPGVVVLATSREPLQFQVEQVMRLTGLAVPLLDGGEGEAARPEPAEGAVADSVLLFQNSANRAAAPITPEMLPVIHEICRFLEGIPLGIELAASWMARLAPTEILSTLQTHADSLALPYRDIPERHRSMPAVFAGSWRLLTPAQQTALAQASVFRSGFTTAAARQIITAAWVDVGALVDKSLLRLEGNGRYTLHELLRQFAAAQLTEHTETAQRHSHYFLGYLAERADALWGREPQVALAELRREFDNVYVGWQTAVASQQFDLLTQSLGGFTTYYARTGLFHEGIQVLTHTLTSLPHCEETQTLQGWLHVELARLLAAVAQFEAAKSHAEIGCQIAITLDDAPMQGWAQYQWARALWMQAHYEEGRHHVKIALAIAHSGGLKRLEAECWRLMSSLADTHGGNFALARDYGEKALAIFHATGNWPGELRLLILLGNYSWGTGDYGLAQGYYEQALPLCREVESRSDEAAALANLGLVLREQGDYGQAAVYAEQGLRLFQEMHDQRREYVTLHNIGLLQHQRGYHEIALTYVRQALAIAQTLEMRAAGSHPLCCLGHALLALNRPQEAAAAYDQSVKLHREAGNKHLAMEPLAGLVRVALAQPNVPQALAYAEEILAYLAQGTLDGTDEPIRVRWTVYQALAAAQDPRADGILAETYQSLTTLAKKIEDADRRQLFWQNVSVHRAIQKVWESKA